MYTICSEATAARQLLRDSTDTPSLLSKFGVAKVELCGDLLLLPEANSSVDDGYQPFDGRFGKQRYLALALMAATSPVAKEVVQLCMSFPEEQREQDPFDFDADEKSSIKRAPVAYPILCSHILTHTTVSLFAVTGNARAEEGKHNIDAVVDDCRNLIQMGFIARVGQSILATLRPKLINDPLWEKTVCTVIEQCMAQTSSAAMISEDEQKWRRFCLSILLIMLSPAAKSELHSSESTLPSNTDQMQSWVLNAIESARPEAVAFLRDISIICQILIPNIFCTYSASQDVNQADSLEIVRCYMELLRLESYHTMLDSNLLQEIMKSWYAQATGKNTTKLDFPRVIQGATWPCISQQGIIDMPPNCSPLLGNGVKPNDNDTPPRILYLPKVYTDLYAQLNTMSPNNEKTALCLVCGEVLDANGKGLCTKHSYTCGGGTGIFFLLQDCVSLIMHGQKAAYIDSPYVDSHGETPQYRGRPLNLDKDRYNIMQSLWSGHLVREKVIAERASTRELAVAYGSRRQPIIRAGYY